MAIRYRSVRSSPIGVLALVGMLACGAEAGIARGQPASAFDCAETLCPDIATCAEAAHKLLVCGHSDRDRDGDGIPCETLCGGDLETYRARVAATMPALAARIGAAGTALDALGPPRAAVADGAPGTAAEAGATGSPGTALRGGVALFAAPADGAFACGGKRTCGQMTSCAEARFHLETCGVKSLDGDRDGRPCNALCRTR